MSLKTFDPNFLMRHVGDTFLPEDWPFFLSIIDLLHANADYASHKYCRVFRTLFSHVYMLRRVTEVGPDSRASERFRMRKNSKMDERRVASCYRLIPRTLPSDTNDKVILRIAYDWKMRRMTVDNQKKDKNRYYEGIFYQNE
ncbi:hypothetical protein ACFE04_011426 [Oxalis oulophora]